MSYLKSITTCRYLIMEEHDMRFSNKAYGKGYIEVNLTYQNRAMRWYYINKEQLTVPSEGPSPCKTKSTAREIHKFGTPMAEPECALTHAVTSFNQILSEFVRFQNQTESNVRIKATKKNHTNFVGGSTAVTANRQSPRKSRFA